MQQAEELGDFIYVPPKEDKEEEEEFTDAAQVSGGDGWGGGGTGCLCWDILEGQNLGFPRKWISFHAAKSGGTKSCASNMLTLL